MSFREHRTIDPEVTDVNLDLDRDDFADFVQALSQGSNNVANLVLGFQHDWDTKTVGGLKALLSYIRWSKALRTVGFDYSTFHQLPSNGLQRQSVVEAFSHTIAAANANPNVDEVAFNISLLTATEMVSDNSFYPSLQRVRLSEYNDEAFSEPDTQAIQHAVGMMSNLVSLNLFSRQATAVLLLGLLYSHQRLEHLSVLDCQSNLEIAQALSGLLMSTTLQGLEVNWEYNSCFAEKFEIIAGGLECCPTLVHLSLSCHGAGNLLPATCFFHQCSTVSSIRQLSLSGSWNTLTVVTSILTGLTSDAPSLPGASHSIGASLQKLTLDVVSSDILEFLATNTSRLPHLSIKNTDLSHLLTLCQTIPVFTYLRELSVELLYLDSMGRARTAMLQALRINGSLQTVTMGPIHGDPTQVFFTAIELRFVDAYLQRNRRVHELGRRRDSLDPDEKDKGDSLLPFLLEAAKPAQRTVPTVLLARALLIDGDEDEVKDRVG